MFRRALCNVLEDCCTAETDRGPCNPDPVSSRAPIAPRGPSAAAPGRRATRLQRALAEESAPRRSTPLDAFLRARRKSLAAERVDMSALADDRGVNRGTRYRWVGSREQLLVEVIWSLASRTLE